MRNRPTNREERAEHVAQMKANFSLEGLYPQADDLELQERYIDGAISLDVMLQAARDYALNISRNASGLND